MTQRFDLTSGALCLDFVNTFEDRGRAQTESLHDFADLLVFAQEAELVGDRGVAALNRTSQDRPEEAARVLRRAIRLRDALYRLFTACTSDGKAPQADLDLVNQELAGAMGELRLEPQSGCCRWSWAHSDDPVRLLRPILYSAGELLTSGDLRRVRECDSPTCTWLFIDRSRNRSRRWCDMQTCGNRAKARRHYRRRKAPR